MAYPNTAPQVPGYRPLPQPGMSRAMPQGMGPGGALTYEQWLMYNGLGNPNAQNPAAQFKPPTGDIVRAALDSLPGAGAGAGSAAVSTAAGVSPAAGAAESLGLGLQSTAPEVFQTAIPEGFLAAEAASPWALSGIGSAGNAYLPIAGLVGGYDVLANDRGPVRGGLQGAASGAAIGSYFGPGGALIGGGIGGTVGLAKGLMEHESTRDVAKKHTKSLQGQFPDDPTYQAYVRGMREQYNSAPPDPSKPFAGKYATWEDYRKGGLEAGDLTGVYGNIKTFGNEWSKLNLDQQKAITQAIINAGLYDSKKGEVEITDANKAKELYQQTLAGKLPTTMPAKQDTMTLDMSGAVPYGGRGTPAPFVIPRSSTRSPGIDKQGNRIRY